MHVRVSERDLRSKALWDASYDLSTAKNLWGDPPVPFVATAVERFRSTHASIVIDLPCGDGRNVPALAESIPFVVGADSAPNALAIAHKTLAESAVKNCVLVEADIFATGFYDDQFDGVFCCDVLSHLTDPLGAFRELLRICRPGGYVVANLFALGDSTRGPNMIAIGDEEYIFDDRFYFKFYSRTTALAFLAEVGVVPERLDLVRWWEPGHEGYREYEHEHESWVAVVRKEG